MLAQSRTMNFASQCRSLLKCLKCLLAKSTRVGGTFRQAMFTKPKKLEESLVQTQSGT